VHDGARDVSNHALWAITSYFNPRHYRRRLANYKTFHRHLAVPLVAVEWSCDGVFELGPSDADILIQLGSPDLLWQKERLLNLAVAGVPRHVERIAWLDCDIVFSRPDWWREALRLLDRVVLVQLFSLCHDLGSTAPPGAFNPVDAVNSAESFVRISRSPGSEAMLFDRLWGSEVENGTVVRRQRLSGLAWAARRELLERHGLYDACVLGAGDRAYACAAFAKQRMARQGWLQNPRQREHYLQWSEPLAEEIRGRIALVEGDVFHLWHGHVRERRYRERYTGFERFAFDPFGDIVIDEMGLWRWASGKIEMHRFVADYFSARREDG
jgi:hypothetical protein